MAKYRPFCSPATCLVAAGVVSEISSSSCPAVTQLYKTLREVFGHSEFRPGQLNAAVNAMHGRDVFVQMSTGAGKTLCMFLPPLAMPGSRSVGVIISPLNAIMDEQILKLGLVGIPALRVATENKSTFAAIESGTYRFVFMSPETATTKPWRDLFSSAAFRSNLVLLAIDEAHCISEWGKEFRQAFKRIGGLRALTKVPFMTLTASAPVSVQEDIIQSLSLTNIAYVKCSLDRPNIHLSVAKKSSLARDLSGFVKKIKSCDNPITFPKTLIFCRQKRGVCDVYDQLKSVTKSDTWISVYHASLSDETKEHVYNLFSRVGSELRCVISTIAFGMGVDIPDVRLVLLYGLPTSLLQFYQLSGRAGRDGNPARSVLITNRAEVKNCKDKPLVDIVSAGKGKCRRRLLLSSLSDEVSPPRLSNLCCDNCRHLPIISLRFITPVKVRRKEKNLPVREVPEQTVKVIKVRLLSERENMVGKSSQGLKALGGARVCPKDCIDEICKRVNHIKEFTDISNIPGLHSPFTEKFFNVVKDSLIL